MYCVRKGEMPVKKRTRRKAGKKQSEDLDEECFSHDYLLNLIHQDSEHLQKFLKQVSVKEVRVLFKDMRATENDIDREKIFHPSLRCVTGEYATLQLVKPYKGH